MAIPISLRVFDFDMPASSPFATQLNVDAAGLIPDEGDDYSIGALSKRYILGEGWNGVGFPTAMLFQFVDNQTPRPASFCGIDRGDHDGSDAYNAEWQQWLSALEAYLTTNGLLEKSYYYVRNEPQDDTDHALAAHLCRRALLQRATPGCARRVVARGHRRSCVLVAGQRRRRSAGGPIPFWPTSRSKRSRSSTPPADISCHE